MWPALFKRLQQVRLERQRNRGEGSRGQDTTAADNPVRIAQETPGPRPIVSLRSTRRYRFTSGLPRPSERDNTNVGADQVLDRVQEQDALAREQGNATITESTGASSMHSRAPTDIALEPDSSPGSGVTNADPPGAVAAESSADFDTSDYVEVSCKQPPAAVTDAIQDFPNIDGITIVPPSEKETSYIYKWGVRVEVMESGKPVRHWICLADDSCRTEGTNFTLSSNRTSKPAHHLATVHKAISLRMETRLGEKRKREDELEHLRSSTLFKTNPRRFGLLVETLRIVMNNLPFRFVEYKESRIVESLLKREDVQNTINAFKVSKSIVELYTSTKREVMRVLADSSMYSCGNFALMADLWTSKTSHRKFLGVRVYFVDSNWEYRSLLLGVRRFSPSYGDREEGVQGLYRNWIQQVLEEFGISTADFFGATSDAGSDIKNLLRVNLALQWEWCMAHMAHAATKEACGMRDDIRLSRNPEMSNLVARIKRTISNVQAVEKTGALFSALCKTRTNSSTTHLVSYAQNRFLGITGSIRRILELWNALVEWYEERQNLALRQREPPPPRFPLQRNQQDLEQILSLLQPIESLKRICQAEEPNQVDVLMELYQIRLDTLCLDKPLTDYRSTDKDPKWIAVDDLSVITSNTRCLLRDAFDSRFFCRYTTETYLDEGEFIFEMQQRLHPEYKDPEFSLNQVIRLLYSEKYAKEDKEVTQDDLRVYVERVNEAITRRLRTMMGKVRNLDDYNSSRHAEEEEKESEPVTGIRARFGLRRTQHLPPQQPDHIAQELRRWEDDRVKISVKENVLDFWKRMEHSGKYHLLPRVAKILFAVPSSSAQIERDFSVCGDMVTCHRTSLKDENVDMCAFLNRNKEFVDISQCEEIPDSELETHVPACMSYVMDTTPEDIEDEMFVDLFSQTSVEE